MQPISKARAREILDAASGEEIAVLGDVMLDRYFWGSVSRVSPEAPVPVVDVDSETFHLGGAANVASNLKGLGVKPLLIGVVGDDATGKLLKQIAAEEGLDASGIVTSVGRPTTVKTRVIGNNQQVVRLDRETREAVATSVIDEVESNLAGRMNLKGIIFESYDKGFLSIALVARVVALARSRKIPVFVDPKRDSFFAYKNAFVFKPNRKEAQDALQISLNTEADVHAAGRMLLDKLEAENVLITLGSEGMMLFERNGRVSSVPTVAKRVADVSGAGDTAIATIAAAISGGATIGEAATLANFAAGVVVAEPGIVSVTSSLLLNAIQEEDLQIIESKLRD
ncbi:MAG: bifunctional hydroxymethylpyrimidine kinase/phosphomethylpyrimidine kinase [Ignavibacteria bacterium]|nr:bifunctional hydroxymethylpyrimidine kinase/phosphomethylpyrimidine kinase [Ignavibacteria bacterium]